MDCTTARILIQRGEETQELLTHLAECPACRTRNEATEFVRAPEHRSDLPKGLTLPGPSRRTMVLWIVGGVAAMVIIGAITALVVRQLGSPDPLPMPTRLGPVSSLPQLTIESRPPGNVYIDGRRRGPTPYVIETAPGTVEIEVRAEGFRPVKQQVEVGTTDKSVTFVLEKDSGEKQPRRAAAPAAPGAAPSPAAPADPADDPDDIVVPEGTGFLSITSEPYARVFLDGKDLGKSTPIVKMSLPAGKHRVSLRTETKSLDLDTLVLKDREMKIHKRLE